MWTSPRDSRDERAFETASVPRPVLSVRARYVSLTGMPSLFQPTVRRSSTRRTRNSVSLSSGMRASIAWFGTLVNGIGPPGRRSFIFGMAEEVRG